MWAVNLIVLAFLSCEVTSLENSSKPASGGASGKKPNFVVFLVDDLGIGDIGCFGNDTIKTPNIDRLASMGAKLNHNLAPESICSPSRAAMLTGRYAIRSGIASEPGEIRVFSNLASSGGLPSNETTFGKVLQETGYRTSMIGKWHLGLNCNSSKDRCHHPVNMGFEEFYGLPLTNLQDCGPVEDGTVFLPRIQKAVFPFLIASVIFGLAMAFTGIFSKKKAAIFLTVSVVSLLAGPVIAHALFSRFSCLLMREFDVVEQPTILENLTVKFTNEATNFIHSNKEKPFLLFMSYVKVHVVLFTSAKFRGHSVHGRYGDNVEEMDWSVGEIISALERENILENTFVYFTSDHGPYLELVRPSGEHFGGSNGLYRGGKGQSWEGGIRVPTVAMWKDRIPPGVVINEPTNTMDIFTTMAEVAGASIPGDRAIDGKNILPLLTQEQLVSPHEFMFHYCGSAIHAVRYRPRTGHVTWKAHFITPKWAPGKEACPQTLFCLCFGENVNVHDPPLLYDISNDPYEQQPLDTSTEAHRDIIIKIREATTKHQLGIKTVPKQLGFPNAWWNPRLQPCCNFPYCSCIEPQN